MIEYNLKLTHVLKFSFSILCVMLIGYAIEGWLGILNTDQHGNMRFVLVVAYIIYLLVSAMQYDHKNKLLDFESIEQENDKMVEAIEKATNQISKQKEALSKQQEALLDKSEKISKQDKELQKQNKSLLEMSEKISKQKNIITEAYKQVDAKQVSYNELNLLYQEIKSNMSKIEESYQEKKKFFEQRARKGGEAKNNKS